MVRWVVRYSITITWSDACLSPIGAKRYQTTVDRPGQLRHLVERARADDNVVSFPITTVRQLVGEPPTSCPHGHQYPTGYLPLALASRGWLPCDCGGHRTLVCGQPECAHRWLGPDPDDDLCTEEVRAWTGATPEEAAAAVARRVNAAAPR